MSHDAAPRNNDSAQSAAVAEKTAASASGENLTSRHWDGWPTAPTPAYLIPEMGKVPVSSTTLFQSVAMTELGEGITAEALWHRLRRPMLEALRDRFSDIRERLRVIEARFGDFRPSQTIDVTAELADKAKEEGTLSVAVSAAHFGDPAPGLPRMLEVSYMLDELPHTAFADRVPDGETLSIAFRPTIRSANYGLLEDAKLQADVTTIVQSHITDTGLRLDVSNSTFGMDPAPNRVKQLRVDYDIAGETAQPLVVAEGEQLTIPSGLRISHARYGFLNDNAWTDVTSAVEAWIDEPGLVVQATNEALRLEQVFGHVRHLHIDYTIDGAPHTVEVAEGETARIIVPEYTPDGIYQRFFEPQPDSLTTLAGRLRRGGFSATDFVPDDEFASLEDALERLMGIARHDALDPLVYATPDAVAYPCEGVILYHEQGWYGRGLALGNLLHSVALAPGEVTQVAMTHWNHATRAIDSESVSQADRTGETSTQDRAVSEIQQAAMREHTSGGSSADSAATSASFGSSSTSAHAGFNLFKGVNGSVSGTSSSVGSTHSVSTVVTHSAGDRTLAMGANQSVNALTSRHAEAARTRRASVVREVAQSEDETLTTRVVANYNHMHAMSVMYFEVVEVYSLKTRVMDAERLIFLPFKVRDIRELVPRYRSVLIDATLSAGRSDMAAALRHAANGSDEIKLIGEKITRAGSDWKDAKKERDEMQEKIASLVDGFEKQIGELHSQQQKIANERNTLLRTLEGYAKVPDFLGEVVRESIRHQLAPLDARARQVQHVIDALVSEAQQHRAYFIARRTRADETMQRYAHEKRDLERARDLMLNLVNGEANGPFHEYKLQLNQAVWLSLSSAEVLGLARRLDSYKGEPLYHTVDPTPVAITGNCVAYRWRHADLTERHRFKRRFVDPFLGEPDGEPGAVEADIAVPTGGVFGEAVLGNGVSAEKIDLSRFWNWKDSMIPILPTGIDSLKATEAKVQDLDAKPGELDESSARLGALQDLPTPSGFGALAQTMQAQVFRDMSGQSMLQSLAEATTAAASSGEQNAAQIASKNLQAGLDFMSDMASKALAAAAAPETGGTSLLGGMVRSREGGGSSLLGGVLNAEGASSGQILDRITGGSGRIMSGIDDTLIGGLAGAQGNGSSNDADVSDDSSDEEAGGGVGGELNENTDEGKPSGENTDEESDQLPPSELEPNPPVPKGD